jgi:pimeloyl-ACP methyl ester carboxylesterase
MKTGAAAEKINRPQRHEATETKEKEEPREKKDVKETGEAQEKGDAKESEVARDLKRDVYEEPRLEKQFNPSAANDNDVKATGTGEVSSVGTRQAQSVAPTPAVANDSDDSLYDGHLIGRGERNADDDRRVLAYPPGTDTQHVPGFVPRHGIQNDTTLIYTNGINNDVYDQSRSMQALADISGSRVIGVHNSTKNIEADLVQSADDKLPGGSENKAVTSLRNTIRAELEAGRDVHLVGHSQGALITAKALEEVKQDLDNLAKDRGSAERAALLQQRYNNIKVETYGGAATTYPKGPKYVHYVNTRDPVPRVAGLSPPKGDARDLRSDEKPPRYTPKPDRYLFQSAAGGPGSVVHFIDDDRTRDGNVIENHDFNDGYLHHRQHFSWARRDAFPSEDRQTRDLPPAGGPLERYEGETR